MFLSLQFKRGNIPLYLSLVENDHQKGREREFLKNLAPDSKNLKNSTVYVGSPKIIGSSTFAIID